MSNDKALSFSHTSSNDSNIIEDSVKSESVNTSSDLQEEELRENAIKIEEDQCSLTEAIVDIEKKLIDALTENVKLKNILTQKDSAIRKQFNTIVLLEKEVLKVCENYKNRFFEIKNLVIQLKQKNEKFHAIMKSSNLQNSSINSILSDEVETEDGSITTSTSEFELNSTEDVKQIQSKLKIVEKQREDDLEQFNKQLKIIQNELEVLKQNLTLPEKSKLLKFINEDYKKELERKYLLEVIKSFDQKMQISHANFDTQVRKHTHESNIQNKKWDDFIECFIEQCVHNTDFKKFQDQCKNVGQIFKNIQLATEDFVTNNDTQVKNGVIYDYRKILIDQQIQCIRDERTTLNIQRKFLKVLSDYDKVVMQLEILQQEDSRLNEMQKIECNGNNFAEIEKCLLEEKQNFDIEREKMSEERLNIEKEKQSIREEWELLSAERTVLLEEKNELIEENKRLELQDSLLQQKITESNNIKFEQTNDVVPNEKMCQITAELNGVKKELQDAHKTITNLREELSKLNQQESEVTAYKLQAEMQEVEFLEMREAERNYLQQIQNLSTEVHQLREENQQLANRIENEHENACQA